MELLNNAGIEFSPTTKLHFQLRLKARDYKGIESLHAAAENIVVALRSKSIGKKLVAALDAVARRADGEKISRFGWLYGEDIEILSAIALPISNNRDPFARDQIDSELDDDGHSWTVLEMALLGAALAIALVLLLVLYLHMRLRQEYELMSKDKSNVTKSSEALRKLWAKFAAIASKTGQSGSNSADGGSLSRSELEKDLEMSRTGLMQPIQEE